MRRRHLRFKMRTLMVLVALAGLACLGGREIWERWLCQDYPTLVSSAESTEDVERLALETLMASLAESSAWPAAGHGSRSNPAHHRAGRTKGPVRRTEGPPGLFFSLHSRPFHQTRP
jgi:hypothetical protein